MVNWNPSFPPTSVAVEASLPDRTGMLGGSPYADPREVEHPLTPIGTLDVSKFAWIQPRLMHPAYELWGGEYVVATLRYRDLSRRHALAASADGVWHLEESPVKGEVFRVEMAGRPVAVFQRGAMNDGSLVIRSERHFPWVRRKIWDQTFAFLDPRGAEYLRFEGAGSGSDRTLLVISPTALLDPDVTLLAAAGKYLTLSATSTSSRSRSK